VDELFSTLVYLIPFAFFIFIRLRGERKRQAAKTAEARRPPGEAAVTPPKGKIIEVGRPRPLRRHAPPGSDAAGEDTSSMLQRLFGNGLYAQGTVTRETGMSGPELAAYARREAALLPEREEAAGRETPAPAPPPPRTTPAAAAPKAPEPAVFRTPSARRTLPKKLTGMAPLRRAIVMAEILGKPKGLE
jgi:hypothetical protein